MRARILLAGTLVALLAAALPGMALAAGPGPGTCSNGTMADGTYNGFVVKGACTIAYGANVHINGDLILTKGAKLNDHGAEAWMHAQLHVSGSIYVHQGAVLGMGWNAGGPLPGGEGALGPDTVGGSIIASKPLAMQIGGVRIGGNLISNGGGVPSASLEDFRNFPVEDNVIHGNLAIQGWRGGWFGVIRNTIHGNAIISKNVSISSDEGPGMDTDSNEVMSSDASPIGGPVFPQTIGGNLICYGNSPAAQYNPLDFGAKNFVGGKALGQCADLAQ
jgi:hypothetical protein